MFKWIRKKLICNLTKEWKLKFIKENLVCINILLCTYLGKDKPLQEKDSHPNYHILRALIY